MSCSRSFFEDVIVGEAGHRDHGQEQQNGRPRSGANSSSSNGVAALDTLFIAGDLHAENWTATSRGVSGINGMWIRGRAENRAGGSKRRSVPYGCPKPDLSAMFAHSDDT